MDNIRGDDTMRKKNIMAVRFELWQINPQSDTMKKLVGLSNCFQTEYILSNFLTM